MKIGVIKSVVKSLPKLIKCRHAFGVHVVHPVSFECNFGFRASVNSADVHFAAFHKGCFTTIAHYPKRSAAAAGRDFFCFTAIV